MSLPSLWVVLVLTAAPGMAYAAAADVPASCEAAIMGQWHDWRLSRLIQTLLPVRNSSASSRVSPEPTSTMMLERVR
jgi:hypothetical protein